MLLEVEGLHKAYGEIVVADGIGFALDRSQCLGVIGPNGAGKSTLFNLLTGLVAPERGRITLDGEQMVGLPAHQRARRGIARAFQVPQPFPHLSVYENTLAAATFGAGLHGLDAERSAEAALARTALRGKADVLAGTLPLLDRKRLEVAKAVACAPKLLLLDEVAAGLTEREVHVLVELVRQLKRDYAIVWIEHIAHALKAVADRVMVLHFGRKLIEDTPQRVMASAVVHEVYMGIPNED